VWVKMGAQSQDVNTGLQNKVVDEAKDASYEIQVYVDGSAMVGEWEQPRSCSGTEKKEEC